MSPWGWNDVASVLPVLVLAGTAALLIVVDALARAREAIEALPALALMGALGTLAAVAWGGPEQGFGGQILNDGFARGCSVAIALALALSVLTARDILSDGRLSAGEFYQLACLAAAGMLLMVRAGDLPLLFLGIEILSIPVYCLTGYDRRRADSIEGALKYFVLGAFASALLLLGMTLIYGATGEVALDRIREAVATAQLPGSAQMLTTGLVLLIVGLAFKLGVVPFHWWLPDAYQGARAPVSGFMATAVKAAGFAAALRWLVDGLGAQPGAWRELFFVLAAVTMLWGNAVALRQASFKRMLAYSGVAHTGYLLIGVVAGLGQGAQAVAGPLAFYLVIYTLMTLGAFALPTLLARDGEDRDRIDDYAGLARERPFAAACTAIFMLSLAGVPPTGGFFAKLTLFAAAVQGGEWVLAALGVLASVISVFYYLRPVVKMFVQPPESASAPAAAGERESAWGSSLVLALCGLGVVLSGLLPSLVQGIIGAAGLAGS